MKIIDIFILSLRNLLRRKLRTFLTMLSVMIGTSSIVLMLSLGFAISKNNKDFIETMGDLTTINVYNSDKAIFEEKEIESKTSNKNKLNDQTIKKISEISNVKAVLPKLDVPNIVFISGKAQGWSQLIGVDPGKLEEFGIKIEEGRHLKSGDKLSLIFTKIEFGSTNGREYIPKEINPFKDRVIMRLGYKDEGFNPEGKSHKTYIDYKPQFVGKIATKNDFAMPIVYINIDTAKEIYIDNHRIMNHTQKKKIRKDMIEYTGVDVKVTDIQYVREVQKEIDELGFRTSSLVEISEGADKENRNIQTILGGIGAVALVVAAIGIANTMIMSIYERSKEIGVMKVIGASISNIRNIFLFEAGLIGFSGGLLGIILSIFVSNFLNSQFGNIDGFGQSTISFIPNWLLFTASIFSAFIGIISGYFPAVKATKISAIEAIRTNG